MIKLTNDASGEAGNPLYIAPENITAIRPWDGTTRVDRGGAHYFVAESPEEVARKILEYKSGVRHHQAAINNGDLDLAVMHEQSLMDLAGL